MLCIEHQKDNLMHFGQKSFTKGQMVRILSRHRPRHAGHSLASNKDLLPMKPAVPASVCASSECKDEEMTMFSSHILYLSNNQC
jgi:hypothetical protein